MIRLSHYAIRASDLDASARFYAEALDLVAGPRPPFGFPGRWLYAPDAPEGQGLVHLIGAGADGYLGARPAGRGGGAVDHLAFAAAGWAGTRARLQRLGVAFEERTVPALGQRQLFLVDPDGVVVELNFAAEAEGPD